MPFNKSLILIGFLLFIQLNIINCLESPIPIPKEEINDNLIDEKKHNIEERDFILPRPNSYFGLRSKSKTPFYFGIAWNEFLDSRSQFFHIREVIQYEDQLEYKINEADGLTHAKVTITDQLYMDVDLEISYVKPSEDPSSFIVRISGRSNNEEESIVSLYSYLSIDPQTGSVTIVDPHPHETDDDAKDLHKKDPRIEGFIDAEEQLGEFELKTISSFGEWSWQPETYYMSSDTTEPFFASSTIFEGVHGGYSSVLPDTIAPKELSNIAVLQKVLKTPFEWELVFQRKAEPIEDPDFYHDYSIAQWGFDHKFQEAYPNVHAGKHSSFGRTVLSHLLFGLSYFAGDRLAYDPVSDQTYNYPDSELFSMIPSKPGFPRPFFWDEAFHLLVILDWDTQLVDDIVESWFQLQNTTTGWIAREQVIGEEARSRCPEWAWPGQMNQMNPPAMFKTLEIYYEKHPAQALDLIRRIYPNLVAAYNWYAEHQAADLPNTFVWKGRKGEGALDSGLDDYPRAKVLREDEKSVDLQAWMTSISDIMYKFAEKLGKFDDSRKFYKDYNARRSALLRIFWDKSIHFYSDVSGGEPVSHIGIAGMLPICLGLEPPTSTRIGSILHSIERHLVSPYGLLSLSMEDPDAVPSGNYWRGNIWANTNYICARELKNSYGNSPNPTVTETALRIANAIENGLIDTVKRNYYSRPDGSIFETFHPLNGKGYNNKPFSGWTALVLLHMNKE